MKSFLRGVEPLILQQKSARWNSQWVALRQRNAGAVFNWSNLYIACNHCQTAKGVQFSALLLRPDDITYSFERYFIYNYATHTVDINTGALLEDQQRAAETIKIFDFNHAGKIIQRRHSWERRRNNPVHDGYLDDFSYRFIFI